MVLGHQQAQWWQQTGIWFYKSYMLAIKDFTFFFIDQKHFPKYSMGSWEISQHFECYFEVGGNSTFSILYGTEWSMIFYFVVQNLYCKFRFKIFDVFLILTLVFFLLKLLKKSFLLTNFCLISGHNFANAIRGCLLWHVQSCDFLDHQNKNQSYKNFHKI